MEMRTRCQAPASFTTSEGQKDECA